MSDNFVAHAETQMKARLEKFRAELSSVRTGRASPQLVEALKVEAYGSLMPLKQVAAIRVPEARILEIAPWDPSTLESIEKAIQKSDLAIPPQNDGTVIRLNLPTMTEERRRDMVKLLGRTAEEARVALRGERREAIERIKKAEKSKEVSEDQRKRLEEAVQRLTDSFVKQVDEALAQKEKEVTTV